MHHATTTAVYTFFKDRLRARENEANTYEIFYENIPLTPKPNSPFISLELNHVSTQDTSLFGACKETRFTLLVTLVAPKDQGVKAFSLVRDCIFEDILGQQLTLSDENQNTIGTLRFLTILGRPNSNNPHNYIKYSDIVISVYH